MKTKCSNCEKDFEISTGRFNQSHKRCKDPKFFCTKECMTSFRTEKQEVSCVFCSKTFLKLPKEIRKSPNHFCSNSCAAKYNNKVSPKKMMQLHKKIDRKKGSILRAQARTIYSKLGRPMQCAICSYPHVEIAHIKPIASFDASAEVGQVNHPNNLIALCRNHHWEFDQGLLVLREGIEPITSRRTLEFEASAST